MIKESIAKAKELVKGKTLKAIGAILLFYVIYFASMLLGSILTGGKGGILQVVCLILTFPAIFGYYKYFLNMLEGKEKVGDIVSEYKNTKKFRMYFGVIVLYVIFIFAAGIIISVITNFASKWGIIGTLIILASYVAYVIYITRFLPAIFIAAERDDMKAADVIKASVKMSKGNVAALLFTPVVAYIMPIILYIVGTLALVGGAVTAMVSAGSEKLAAVGASPEKISELMSNLPEDSLMAVGFGGIMLFVASIYFLIETPKSMLSLTLVYNKIKGVVFGEETKTEETSNEEM